MRSRLAVGLRCALLLGTVALVPADAVAGDPAPQPQAPHPTFGVWYAPGAPDDRAALEKVLGVDDPARVRLFSSMTDLAGSDADLLVIRGTDRSGAIVLDDDDIGQIKDLDGLKGKRVLGIGWEARYAFKMIGLEATDPATFERSGASVVFLPGALRAAVEEQPVESFRAESLKGGKAKWTNEAVHMPRWGPLASKVEAVARWEGHDDYAPLVRQQNYLYCGIAADVRTWTDAFRVAMQESIGRLRARPLEPFALVEWDQTAPGSFEFELTPWKYQRQFFFRFERPTLFSAQLQQSGSSDTALFFVASWSTALRDMERLDGESGETLEVLVPITGECVQANGGRYWTLDLDNFDRRSTARCKLKIDYSTDAVVRFSDGLEVAMANPPTDERTIATLIGRFLAPYPEIRRLANAALLIVGRPAVAALKATHPSDRDGRLRVAMLLHCIEGD